MTSARNRTHSGDNRTRQRVRRSSMERFANLADFEINPSVHVAPLSRGIAVLDCDFPESADNRELAGNATKARTTRSYRRASDNRRSTRIQTTDFPRRGETLRHDFSMTRVRQTTSYRRADKRGTNSLRVSLKITSPAPARIFLRSRGTKREALLADARRANISPTFRLGGKIIGSFVLGIFRCRRNVATRRDQVEERGKREKEREREREKDGNPAA